MADNVSFTEQPRVRIAVGVILLAVVGAALAYWIAAGRETTDYTQVDEHVRPIFARSGVTIKNCKPAQVPVFVDQYKDYEAEVQPPEKMTNLVGTPIFEPPKVRIRAPSSKLPVPAPTVVFADLQSTGLTDKPGQHGHPRLNCTSRQDAPPPEHDKHEASV